MTMIAPQVQHSFAIRKEKKKKTKKKKTRNPAAESSSCYGSDNLFPTVNVPGGLTGNSEAGSCLVLKHLNARLSDIYRRI